MKCVCIADCYLKHESERHVHYTRGDVREFDDLPSYFVAADGAVKKKDAPAKPAMTGMPDDIPTDEFDFESAPEDVLLAAEYEITDLINHAKTNYGITIRKSENKSAVVAKFVDARYRNAMKVAGLTDSNS
jgi:hypothetical protein